MPEKAREEKFDQKSGAETAEWQDNIDPQLETE